MTGILKITELLEGTRSGVLFVCPGNGVRSQMAEGFARYLCPSDLQVFSAADSGTPLTEIAAPALRAMKEVGIDLSTHQAKVLDAVPLERIAIAISLSEEGEEGRGALPDHIQILDWPIADPGRRLRSDEDALKTYRRLRDQVREMVSALF